MKEGGQQTVERTVLGSRTCERFRRQSYYDSFRRVITKDIESVTVEITGDNPVNLSCNWNYSFDQ